MIDELSTAIFVEDDFLDSEACHRIIDWLETGEGFGADEECTHDHRNVPFMSFTNPEFIDVLHKRIHDAVAEYADRWGTEFNERVPLVHYNRYLPDEGHLDVHYDIDGRGKPYHLSAILYLNDDFDEGETVFERLGTAIQPKPGRLVIFPSVFIYAHSARYPRNGTKYVAAFWFWH